jgi:hypothetical protein
LIVAGARRRQARVLIVAFVVFVVAAALRIAATGYANRVQSGHSIVGCFRDNLPTDLTTLLSSLPPSAPTT